MQLLKTCSLCERASWYEVYPLSYRERVHPKRTACLQTLD